MKNFIIIVLIVMVSCICYAQENDSDTQNEIKSSNSSKASVSKSSGAENKIKTTPKSTDTFAVGKPVKTNDANSKEVSQNTETTPAAEPAIVDASEPDVVYDSSSYPAKEINVPHALLRGVTNLGTFWLEIPRELVMESNYNPVYGVVVGAVKGTYYAGRRVVYGALDIVLLGFTGPSGYSKNFPEYVWEAKWAPWPKDKNPEDTPE